MSSPSDLFGSGSSSGFPLSTDYGTEQFNSNLSASQNVRPISSPDVLPAYKGNYGRKAALMGNWRNPVQGTGGTFFGDEASPPDIPQSDPGSGFALQKKYGDD